MTLRTSESGYRDRARRWAMIAVLPVAAVMGPLSMQGAADTEAKCQASLVKQGSGYLGQIPVVKSQPAGKFVGVLFYARLVGLRDGDTARIKTPSASASEPAKILWQGPSGKTLRVTGRRLDGAQTFTRTFPAATAAGGAALKGNRSEFPSIIDLPTTGCWRIGLEVGKTRDYVVIEGRT